MTTTTAEHMRLAEDASRSKYWKRWGPYLSERQWATVREDYSPNGDSWRYFPHDQAPSRVYRWGEDGLLGITDRQCRLCFALAVWNGHDPILKERLFGLTGPEGNHGEDVKECYYYLDSTPTHSYMKALYKYPQRAFPYGQLREENARRSKQDPEFELADTGIFDEGRYFDVFAEYAKAGPDDVLIRITIANRGPDVAPIHVLPTWWFRNTWVWGCRHEGCSLRPRTRRTDDHTFETDHETLGRFVVAADATTPLGPPTWLLTDNETNFERVYQTENLTPYVKDAFHDYVIRGRTDAVKPGDNATKLAPYWKLDIPAGEEVCLRLRMVATDDAPAALFGAEFEEVFSARIREADEFYAAVIPPSTNGPSRDVLRQSHAGMLWTKQFYHYIVEDWLAGDENIATPPASRHMGRNATWKHLYNLDIVSMPDKWEYPWYAVWDSAFHTIPLADVDPEFAKGQLELFLREWYMHPNGQLPAYEFDLNDVNPPVHAWACWKVYQQTKASGGGPDTRFLASVFYKLLINFTWWVNRKDEEGNHLFSGGFLGLDNIGVFDRSQPLPGGGTLQQADGTAWMAFYCNTMLAMAIELAQVQPAAEDIASKFFEHFVHIADAMNTLGGSGLWDEEDGFYYDQIAADGHDAATPNRAAHSTKLKVRSLVGLVPLFAVEMIDREQVNQLPGFLKRLRWFFRYRSDLAQQLTYLDGEGDPSRDRLLLAIPSPQRLRRVLAYLFDEDEFLSPYGIRSLSKVHAEHPFETTFRGQPWRVGYVPGESDTHMFGGNSNWRGPIWFPANYLVIESLRTYHAFYGDEFRIEYPTRSGNEVTLAEAADDLSQRLLRLFLPDDQGHRPCHGGEARYRDDPHWRDLVLFYEYFHGDDGRGCGASHQTGWTGLVSKCVGDGGH